MRKRQHVQRVPEPLRPREVVIPKESAARITALFADAQRARAAAENAVNIVLEALGADVTKRADGQAWNVVALEDGRLVAQYGPPIQSASIEDQAEALRKIKAAGQEE